MDENHLLQGIDSIVKSNRKSIREEKRTAIECEVQQKSIVSNLPILTQELIELNSIPTLFKEETIKDYKILKLIGKGGFAKVYYCKHRDTQNKLALKVIKKEKFNNEPSFKLRVKKEIEIQDRLNHNNILNLKCFFEDNTNIYLVLELCPYGDMVQYLKSKKPNLLLEDEIRLVLEQVISALSYLHSFNIIHRDLKLSNILIYDIATIKLSDFGLATEIQEDLGEQKTLCGTLNYISPEIIFRKPYNLQSDLWSLGCLTYTLFIGKAPFEGKDIKETIKKVTKVEYTFPNTISEEAKQLINSLLQLEPNKRIKLKDTLKLPFFYKNLLRLELDRFYLVDLIKSNFNSISSTTLPNQELNLYNKFQDLNLEEDKLNDYKFNTILLKPIIKKIEEFQIQIQKDGWIKIQLINNDQNNNNVIYLISSDSEIMKIKSKRLNYNEVYNRNEIPLKYHSIFKLAYQFINDLSKNTVKFIYEHNNIKFYWYISNQHFKMEYLNDIIISMDLNLNILLIESLNKNLSLNKIQLNLNSKSIQLPKQFHIVYKTFLIHYKQSNKLNQLFINNLDYYKNLINPPTLTNKDLLPKLNTNNNIINNFNYNTNNNINPKYLNNVGWYLKKDDIKLLLFLDGVQIQLNNNANNGIIIRKDNKQFQFNLKNIKDNEIEYRIQLFKIFLN